MEQARHEAEQAKQRAKDVASQARASSVSWQGQVNNNVGCAFHFCHSVCASSFKRSAHILQLTQQTW
eukprot:407554-Amphidinium_carterae.1